MTSLSKAMTDARVETHFDSPTDEDAMIERAANGDRAAAKILIDNHLGILVNETHRVMKRAGGLVVDRDSMYEDVFTDAILVFYRVLSKYQPGRGGFAGLLQTALRNDRTFNDSLARVRVMTVTQQTLRRRGLAIKAAEGDLAKARELAPQFGLTRETFDAASQVYLTTDTLGGEAEQSPADSPRGPGVASQGGGTSGRAATVVPAPLQFNDPGFVRIEDLQDARTALSLLTVEEHWVICGLYGLEGWAEKSQYELADELGFSRQKVRRLRDSAMLKMQAHFKDKE